MSTQDLFVKDFLALRDGTIKRVLLDVGRQLLEQGHNYEIGESLALKEPTIGASAPYGSITLEVYPADVDWKAIVGLRPFNKVPSIHFGADLAARRMTVFVHPNCEHGRSTNRGTIIRVGPWTTRHVNSYQLNEVTPEVVHREVKDFFREIPFDVELK